MWFISIEPPFGEYVLYFPSNQQANQRNRNSEGWVESTNQTNRSRFWILTQYLARDGWCNLVVECMAFFDLESGARSDGVSGDGWNRVWEGWIATPWKINMEPNDGDWEDDVHVLFNWVIFGFQPFIFRGVEIYNDADFCYKNSRFVLKGWEEFL